MSGVATYVATVPGLTPEVTYTGSSTLPSSAKTFSISRQSSSSTSAVNRRKRPLPEKTKPHAWRARAMEPAEAGF